jgi:hypothetical protein
VKIERNIFWRTLVGINYILDKSGNRQCFLEKIGRRIAGVAGYRLIVFLY